MRLEDYDILNKILQEFRQEAAQTDVLIGHNTRSIREADACLEALMSSEPDDVKVFSPRKAEVIHKEEIQEIKSRRSVLEEENQKLCSKKAVLEERLEKLEKVLKNQRHDFSSHVELERSAYESAVKNIRLLAKKMEAGCTNMEKNPIQVKQDILIAVKRLRDTADQMAKIAQKDT